jgi:propionyl-CoA carboxylase alpha chain
VAVVEFGPDAVTLEVAGVRCRFDVTTAVDVAWVDSPFGSVRLVRQERLPAPVSAAEPGSLLAPMPGSVVRTDAAVGDRVTAGQVVLVLEAMKMEHQIRAPTAGLLAELRVSPGTQVSAGDVLALVTSDETATQAEEPA